MKRNVGLAVTSGVFAVSLAVFAHPVAAQVTAPGGPGGGGPPPVVVAESYGSFTVPTFEDLHTGWTCQQDVTGTGDVTYPVAGTTKIGKANSPASPSVSFSGTIVFTIQNNGSSPYNTLNSTITASGDVGATTANATSTITLFMIPANGTAPYTAQDGTVKLTYSKPLNVSTPPIHITQPGGKRTFGKGTCTGNAYGPPAGS